ncbi:hypothetical protein F511_12824 [Dorcoceras hygrometricum]|uniref:Uncharacterized protein n=1 Tax=Dorcoceras hygrometricum TaxID=472368 RepID=A0A2Z7CS13_9LAMI|nr:hypothetical protein F511_12824 [Dorcoceras hygrometricum]
MVPNERSRGDELSATNLAANGRLNRRKPKEIEYDEQSDYHQTTSRRNPAQDKQVTVHPAKQISIRSHRPAPAKADPYLNSSGLDHKPLAHPDLITSYSTTNSDLISTRCFPKSDTQLLTLVEQVRPTSLYIQISPPPKITAQLINIVRYGICKTTSHRFHSTSVYTGNPKRHRTTSRSGHPVLAQIWNPRTDLHQNTNRSDLCQIQILPTTYTIKPCCYSNPLII